MLNSKYERLLNLIKKEERVLIAFSGGVDSSLLATAAKKALGKNAIAVTLNSAILPLNELENAIKVANEIGLEHLIVESNELENKPFVANQPDRCYHCRKESIRTLKKIAEERNIKSILFGVNVDDLDAYRPGNNAIKEEGSLTPLVDSDLTKKEVRKLAEELNISTSLKPSMACLATRIAYNEEITKEKLEMIDKAEEYLRNFGIMQVRVRLHDGRARIEVLSADIPLVLGKNAEISDELKKIGFQQVTVDPEGYKSGSMNVFF